MYFFIVILQDSLMASAERNIGWKKEACPILHTVETRGGSRGEGHSAWICSQGGERCGRSTPVRLKGRDRREGEQRAEGGLAGAACPPRQLVILSGRLHMVSWFHLLVISSSSPPRPSRVKVIDQRRCDWPASLQTGGLMVSLSLRRENKGR